MKIQWDTTLGIIAGMVFVALLTKLFLNPEIGWWEIIEGQLRGIVSLLLIKKKADHFVIPRLKTGSKKVVRRLND